MRSAPLLLLGLSSCSLALDFKSESDLPCPCLPDYICLLGTNRCVKKGSVDDFKSCDLDAERPDDLCKANSICVNNKDRGLRCLPKCIPTSYSTAQSGLRLMAECPSATTCWPREMGGGVCDSGECSELPNNCPPPGECVSFNGAGVCFTPCRIFTADACASPLQSCHPVGDTSNTACLPVGILQYGDKCSDTDACAKPLICDRAQGSGDDLRCLSVCPFPDNSICGVNRTCAFARPMIDVVSGAPLGVCVPK